MTRSDRMAFESLPLLAAVILLAAFCLSGCVQQPRTEVTWGNFHALDTSDKQALSGLTADVTEANGTHIVIGIKDLARDATAANAGYMLSMAQAQAALANFLNRLQVQGFLAPAPAPAPTVIVQPTPEPPRNP